MPNICIYGMKLPYYYILTPFLVISHYVQCFFFKSCIIFASHKNFSKKYNFCPKVLTEVHAIAIYMKQVVAKHYWNTMYRKRNI